MRIERSVFKYIEHELYNYKGTKKELELYREQIIEGTSKPEVAVQSGLGDVTASKAIKLISSTFVLNSEKTINAIEKSIEMLGDKYKKLFELRYVNCIPEREIILEINISRRTYFRMRRELVMVIGQKLGTNKYRIRFGTIVALFANIDVI